jgi:hypothetical protein
MARDHGGRVRPRDQGRQSEKRRFSAKVAAFIVAAQAGMAGTAKNTQDEALLLQTGQALFDYLDSLKP